MFMNSCLKEVFFPAAVGLLFGAVLAPAQQRIEFTRGLEIVSRSPQNSTAADNQHTGEGADRAGGPGATARPDPYPAMTAATQAYNARVKEYQQAYQRKQETAAEYARVKEKYQDAGGEVRPGFDWAAAADVVRFAERKAQYAELELQKSERTLNEAHSRSVDEFRRAAADYSRAAQAEQARQAERDRRNSLPAQFQSDSGRGGH